MRKILSVLIAALLVVSIAPFVAANTPDVGGGVGIIIEPTDFLPLIWMDADSRVFLRNPADGGGERIERVNNYAFEGEQIAWDVLVMDKNGIEKISDVYVTIGSVQGTGNDIEVNCDLADFSDGENIERFNPRIGEEQLHWLDADTMAIYNCVLTVETPNSMYGEYWVVGEVEDLDGNQADFDENEYWFFNPVIALAIDGSLEFENVLPGSASYSDTLRLTNDVDEGSGVLLDMTISGTDFYDPESSGAKCPLSNRIRLNSGGPSPQYVTEGTSNPAATFVRTSQTNCDNPAFVDGEFDQGDDMATEDEFDVLCYYATQGAYQTANDLVRRDIEGYLGIPYETGDESNRVPIISSTSAADRIDFGGGAKEYFSGNVLTPGADMALTFRLFLPEPCNGNFSDGQIYFWGEAI